MLLIVQMIPGQALIIALFVDFNKLGLLENLGGLVIVYAAQALPVSIWMLRNFVATVPKELEEAAAIDGASATADLLADPVPAGHAPGLVATSIFSFITAYNEFIVALTFLGQAHSDLHAADLRDLLLRPRRRAVGPDHGRLHPLHGAGADLLHARPAPPGRRPGGRGGEGMSAAADADPQLGRLADAVLIPPFGGRGAAVDACRAEPAGWPA